MSDFFCGWRRKAGCVTLALALTLMALWLRSIHTKDVVKLISLDEWQSTLLSLEGSLVLNTFQGATHPPMDQGLPRWLAFRIDGSEMNSPELIWIWRWFGFGLISHSPHSTKWVIPYWSIVLPLTTLSGSLLMSKSRNPASVPAEEVA